MSANTDRATDAARAADKAIEPSVFQKALTQDIAEALDQARPRSASALAAEASGPLLMTETLSELENIPDVPFDQLCNDGARITGRNLFGKLLRCVLTPIKEVYLPVMTWGLPTNSLMLTFRTFNRDFDIPNHNEDNLAPLLRDSLMPARGKMHREKSSFLKWKTSLFDLPVLGLPGIVNFIDVRTQWFDAAVKGAIRDGITQVVIIAAGYDTRAYRLAQPGVRFYEIDLPHASEKKQELVREHMPKDKYSWPEFVAADLSQTSLMEALSNTSWNRTKRTVFIIEGLVYYLPAAAFKQQLTAITETAVVGSRLFFDFIHLDAMSAETYQPGFETLWLSTWNKGEPMFSGIDANPAAIRSLLKKFGFRLYEVLTAKEITERFHPHVTSWNSASPHVPPYFGYIAAEKVYAPFKRKDTLPAPLQK